MTIDIPIDASKILALKTGMMVDLTTPLYKSDKAAKKEERIEIASLLSIHPKNIFTHLKKNVGDTVAIGDILAEKSSLFQSQKVVAKEDGVITEVDHIDGIILIETPENSFLETCWFKGEIEHITKNHITLKIGKHITVPVKNISSDFGGTTWVIPDHVYNVPENPVAVCERLTTYDLAKLEAIGTRGVIAAHSIEMDTSLPRAIFKSASDFEEIRKKEYPYCVSQAMHSTIIFYSV